MPDATQGTGGRGRSRTVGLVLGLAFGVATSTVLSFRMGGYLVLLPFIALVPIATGPLVGILMARSSLVPGLRRGPMWAFAAVIASAPLLAGSVEIRLRDDPFPFPPETAVARWSKYPWGERVAILQGSQPVPVMFDGLVGAATDAGWTCRSCRYQPSTGTGHASFETRPHGLTGPRGRLGVEVWPGEMALYGRAPSAFTQARVFHDRPTASPALAVTLLFALVTALALSQRRQRKGRRSC